MRYRVITDSSANLFSLADVDFVAVPLKIITEEKEYTDDAFLDVPAMVHEVERTKGSSGTSCPNAFDWLSAFEGAERIIVLTLTGNLSGSYQAAQAAAEEYMENHPTAKVWVLDTRSAGPEIQLIVEKIREWILSGMEFEEIITEIERYKNRTHLLFSLESLRNLANNGRVSPGVAKVARVLGIRIVGAASDEGTLEPLHKCRGEKRAWKGIFAEMEQRGFCGGRVRIAHCFNETASEKLKEAILDRYPEAEVTIIPCGGLCSFYAERGGLLVGFEGS